MSITSENTQQNPKTKYPAALQPAQQQQVPGKLADLTLEADHGEESYMGSSKLKGKKAIITGKDSGIGQAVAIAYAREGADVLISYLNEDKDAKDTASYVAKAGQKAIVIPGDISEAEKGIRANCVAPGPIWTSLIPSTRPNEEVEKFGADGPIQRPGQPAGLAAVYVLLASDEASYVSGDTVPVTGGKPSI